MRHRLAYLAGHPAQTLPCPRCMAQRGQPCVQHTTAGDFPTAPGWVHPERETAWKPIADELRATTRRLARCPQS